MKVELGRLVATAGVDARMNTDVQFRNGVMMAINRHAHADWGDDLCAEDRELNDRANIRNGEGEFGGRLLSSYQLEALNGEMVKVWIITEWDRSVTTVLFPEEY